MSWVWPVSCAIYSFLAQNALLLKVTRDYDEEEQGYDSGKEGEVDDEEERKSDSDSASPPKPQESDENLAGESGKKSKQNGDDHHDEEDMEMSDWVRPGKPSQMMSLKTDIGSIPYRCLFKGA